MTDEKMAEEFADNIDGLYLTCSLLSAKDKSHAYRLGRYDGFLAGLEAGRPQWHDLRKDPTDVPKENVTVLLLTEVEPVTARYDNEYEAFFRLNDKLNYCVFIAPMSYIAWCEIPKFDEE